MFSKNKNKNWHVLTLDGLLALTSNIICMRQFYQNTNGQFFFPVPSEHSKRAMVSTHNNTAQVDTEPISDYYEKHL